MRKFRFKKWMRMILWMIIVVGVIIIGCNVIIAWKTSGKCYDEVADIPANKVGLVLGTSSELQNGRPNLYFVYRIRATVELYRAGKIKYILVSGDNSAQDYNEPQDMKDALVAKGIPANAIYLDYAGLRTLDSVVRAKLIFGQDKFTIISQRFHNERAVYIAGWHDIKAVGYNAKDVTVSMGLKTRVREWLARVKVFIDLIIDKKPRYLGETIQIPS